MTKSNDSLSKELESLFLDKIKKRSFDRETRAIAERVRQEAIAHIRGQGEICDKKQRLIDSIQVIPGSRKNEYLVVSEGEYGKDMEFGTKKTAESPWFYPSFVTVAGSIDTCQHGTPDRAEREDEAASRVLMNSGPAVISSSSR